MKGLLTGSGWDGTRLDFQRGICNCASMFQRSFLPILSAAVVLSCGLVQPASAQKAETTGLDKKEANQAQRITKGVQSGRLTAQEAARLQAMEAKLNADEAAAKADGKVTKQERKTLNQEAKADSKAIHDLKHNDDKASAKKEGKKKAK